MNKLNSYFHQFGIFLFLCFLFISCKNKPSKFKNLEIPLEEQDSIEIILKDSVYSTMEAIDSKVQSPDKYHFELVKLYIEKIGKYSKFSLSSLEGDTSLMVHYYRIEKEGWTITKDHHTRIYFSYEDYSYGNIFLQQDSVQVEANYLGPKETIDTLNEVILPISKLYQELVNEALELEQKEN